ncbi:MAG TPA: hypothetical protein VKX49_03840 [Bryobacteraceae bacterium]|nr:hypothetical protein [Bryobacteraceae bacterium]
MKSQAITWRETHRPWPAQPLTIPTASRMCVPNPGVLMIDDGGQEITLAEGETGTVDFSQDNKP